MRAWGRFIEWKTLIKQEVSEDEVDSSVHCSEVGIEPARTYCNYVVRDAATRRRCVELTAIDISTTGSISMGQNYQPSKMDGFMLIKHDPFRGLLALQLWLIPKHDKNRQESDILWDYSIAKWKTLVFLLRAYSLRKQNWQFWWHVPLAKDYDLLNGGS